jgi:hypothetical protein
MIPRTWINQKPTVIDEKVNLLWRRRYVVRIITFHPNSCILTTHGQTLQVKFVSETYPHLAETLDVQDLQIYLGIPCTLHNK